jgi:hypothetical protein
MKVITLPRALTEFDLKSMEGHKVAVTAALTKHFGNKNEACYIAVSTCLVFLLLLETCKMLLYSSVVK